VKKKRESTCRNQTAIMAERVAIPLSICLLDPQERDEARLRRREPKRTERRESRLSVHANREALSPSSICRSPSFTRAHLLASVYSGRVWVSGFSCPAKTSSGGGLDRSGGGEEDQQIQPLQKHLTIFPYHSGCLNDYGRLVYVYWLRSPKVSPSPAATKRGLAQPLNGNLIRPYPSYAHSSLRLLFLRLQDIDVGDFTATTTLDLLLFRSPIMVSLVPRQHMHASTDFSSD
jgi:hypothetical protein